MKITIGVKSGMCAANAAEVGPGLGAILAVGDIVVAPTHKAGLSPSEIPEQTVSWIHGNYLFVEKDLVNWASVRRVSPVLMHWLGNNETIIINLPPRRC